LPAQETQIPSRAGQRRRCGPFLGRRARDDAGPF